jgi:hypothetical protein
MSWRSLGLRVRIRVRLARENAKIRTRSRTRRVMTMRKTRMTRRMTRKRKPCLGRNQNPILLSPPPIQLRTSSSMIEACRVCGEPGIPRTSPGRSESGRPVWHAISDSITWVSGIRLSVGIVLDRGLIVSYSFQSDTCGMLLGECFCDAVRCNADGSCQWKCGWMRTDVSDS